LNDPNVDKVLKLHNFRNSPHTNQPRASILIDLTEDLDAIFQRMSKSTKRYVKHSEKQGVEVSVGGSEDFATFYDLMQITGQRGQFSTRIPAYYVNEWETFAKNDQALMLVANYQNQILAIHITYYYGEHAAYFHGASSGKQSDLHSNKLLIWESIKWAKEKGCHTYDLWGIPDEVGLAVYEGKPLPPPDRTDGLWGVYRFKSGFSKNVQYFMGAYDYVYSSLPYMLITNRLFDSDIFEQALALLDRHRKHKK
jgi:lipid II:glycine glycyltransferase (peptidoglycan interpeptide bridge formation enzyme)